jgi:hypothetical protein
LSARESGRDRERAKGERSCKGREKERERCEQFVWLSVR